MKGPAVVVWGAKAIGEVIGRTPRQTHWLLGQGAIQAARKVTTKKRSGWFASVEGLRRQFFPGETLAEATLRQQVLDELDDAEGNGAGR